MKSMSRNLKTLMRVKLAVIIGLVAFAFSLSSHAQSQGDSSSFSDSFWFEPGLACAAGAAAGYAYAPTGDELTYSAGGCLVTGGIMYMINSYYQNKVAKNKDHEIQKLREVIKFQESIQAQKAAKGDPSEVYSLRVQEVVPAQRLPDGSVMAPTIKENLVLPNQNLEVGY